MRTLVRKRKALTKLVRFVIGVTIGGILIVNFALPTLHSAITEYNGDATTKTILGLGELGLAIFFMMMAFGAL